MSDEFIMPERQELEIYESDYPADRPRRIKLPVEFEQGPAVLDTNIDPPADKPRRVGWYGWQEVGFAIINPGLQDLPDGLSYLADKDLNKTHAVLKENGEVKAILDIKNMPKDQNEL